MGRIKQYVPGALKAVPSELYGQMVANVIAAGGTAEVAESLADAALGPLRLVPPLPEDPPQWMWADNWPPNSEDDFCLARYFTPQGEWKYCGEPAGHDKFKAHYAFKPDDLSWADTDPRAIPRDYT